MQQNFSEALSLRLNLPVGCSIDFPKTKSNLIVIKCLAVEAKDVLLEDARKFCDRALAMGYKNCAIAVAGTKINLRYDLSALLTLYEQVRQ